MDVLIKTVSIPIALILISTAIVLIGRTAAMMQSTVRGEERQRLRTQLRSLAVACAVALVLTAAGSALLWSYGGRWLDQSLSDRPLLAVAIGLAAGFGIGGLVSVFLRWRLRRMEFQQEPRRSLPE